MITYKLDELSNSDWKYQLLHDMKEHNKKRVSLDTGVTIIKNIPIRILFLNMFMLQLKNKWRQPVTELLVKKGDVFTTDILDNHLNDIFLQEARTKKHNMVELRNIFCEDFNRVRTDISNFTMTDTQAYSRAISIMDIADFMSTKEFKDIMDIMPKDKSNHDLSSIQAIEKKQLNELTKLINSKDNSFTPFIKSKILNSKQLFDSFISVGYKTDIDDSIINYYINDNYADGITDTSAVIAEAMAPRKSSFYNKSGISTSRYAERLIQLMLSPIRVVYEGDCGTSAYIVYTIREDTKYNFIGKYVILDDGSEVALTESNIDDYLNRPIKTRSAACCRHKDGACERCLGELIPMYMSREYALGACAGVGTMAPTAQKILSAKHFQAIAAILWQLNGMSDEYFSSHSRSIYVKDAMRGYQMVVPVDTIKTFINYPTMTESFDLDTSIMTKIDMFDLYKDGLYENGPINLASDGISPYFSKEFVEYYRYHPDIIQIIDKKAIISMDKYPEELPFLSIDLRNDSMLDYFNRVGKCINGGLSTFNTLSSAVNELTETIWSKVSVNISYVEVMVKALLITNENDHRIPVVNDPNNVTISSMSQINRFRSLTASMANEAHNQVFEDIRFSIGEYTNIDMDEIMF